jgi:hypothetical protein
VTSSSSSRVAATPLQLTALAPSRFLWVEASSGGGSVSVEVVQEGSLTVSTSGGDISVPKVLPPTLHAAGQPLPSGCVPKGGNGCCSGSGRIMNKLLGTTPLCSSACLPLHPCCCCNKLPVVGGWLAHCLACSFNGCLSQRSALSVLPAPWLPCPLPSAFHQVKAVNAHLASGGGAIRGGVTGVDVRLESGGGPVDLKTLVGKLAVVSTSCSGGGGGGAGGGESRGGPLTIGACYAEELKLDSGEEKGRGELRTRPRGTCGVELHACWRSAAARLVERPGFRA